MPAAFFLRPEIVIGINDRTTISNILLSHILSDLDIKKFEFNNLHPTNIS